MVLSVDVDVDSEHYLYRSVLLVCSERLSEMVINAVLSVFIALPVVGDNAYRL